MKSCCKIELVWPGKYDDHTSAGLPHAVLPLKTTEIFEVQSNVSANWRNKLIWADNIAAAESLLESFSGHFDLIYIDPPFATGREFLIETPIEYARNTVQNAAKHKVTAYRDEWGEANVLYLQMMHDCLKLMYKLLAPEGTIFVHSDYRMQSVLKLILDEVFGSKAFLNEIIWHYTGGGRSKKYFSRKHDVIHWYKKGGNHTFNIDAVRQPYKKSSGYAKNGIVSAAGRRYLPHFAGTPADDVWEIPIVNPLSPERIGYPTQKPLALLNRIIAAASKPGDLVGDFFAGSGTTLVAAQLLGRRWIGCDINPCSINTIRKRLIETASKYCCKADGHENAANFVQTDCSFEIMEPCYTKSKAYNGIYVKRVLELYKAEPIESQHLHAKKNEAFVYVGACGESVAFNEIEAAALEAERLGAHELVILGWNYESDIYDLLNEFKQHDLKIGLYMVPHEVMAVHVGNPPDTIFYESPRLQAALEIENFNATCDEIGLRVVLKNLTFSLNDRRLKERYEWRRYIDSWAVDWNFSRDIFVNCWCAYRMPNGSELSLASPIRFYKTPGDYSIMVKIFDVFGNTTSRLLKFNTNDIMKTMKKKVGRTSVGVL